MAGKCNIWLLFIPLPAGFNCGYWVWNGGSSPIEAIKPELLLVFFAAASLGLRRAVLCVL